MNKSTISICEICYKHISAVVTEINSNVWITKTCPNHGTTQYMIERDAEFYNSLICDRTAYDPSGYVVEITDRCNLKCPHCYQEPDNTKKDIDIDFIIDQIANYPNDGNPITLAGAEPTMRPDLFEIIKRIRTLGRDVNILTNGLKLSNLNYVKNLFAAGCEFVTIGLNHPDYQGAAVHRKQLKGIVNCTLTGMRIKNINYTLETLDQIPFILNEIQTFGKVAEEFRIRGGAEIGRHPDTPILSLSDIVKYVKDYAIQKGWQLDKPLADDNVYHYMLNINGHSHRIIQWPDVKTIDLEELQCGPWGNFAPGQPMTNLVHQVIMRDATVNKKMLVTDQVPSKYRR
jgi:organic radical activating enzyme